MTEQRAFLVATLRRVIEGGDVTNEELAAVYPDARRWPKTLVSWRRKRSSRRGRPAE